MTSSLVHSMALLLLVALALRPASAARVAYENCLPEGTTHPTGALSLQWDPKYVDASFDTANPTHRLRVTVWGNVTGSYTNVTLPPLDSPDWKDPNKTDGKIVYEPDANLPAPPKITTLRTKVNVLTYEPWNNNTDFCNDALTNAVCPLAPVFNTSGTVPFPDGLPSVSVSEDFNSSYAFTSFTATFFIIYGNDGRTIGCVSATITPDLGNLTSVLKFLPFVVLVFVGFATVFAGIFSPWGTTDIFHWSSNYGRDADLLRLVTPGFGDCLQYLQFVVLTAGLTLDYPGFYQPIASQASWATLMFNETFVSKSAPWEYLVDGVYVTEGDYGLQKLSQLVGMAQPEDIWAGMMVWLLVIIGAVFVLFQTGFLAQWIYRLLKNTSEEDLRAKNLPFSFGNVVRIVFNYFLLPIVALSTFQLVVASKSPAYTVALAALTLVIIVCFAGWLLYLIATVKPRAFLFDDLPTLLSYGPLYNTYSDEAAPFALVPVLLTFTRGIAIGAVQPSGVAQIVVLAICEVTQVLTVHAFRPFHSPTSMNAYHTIFAVLRLVSVLLMIAFVPSLGVTAGPKGWIGYAILLAHACVLVLGFFLNALQTIIEVTARMLGAGGDHVRGQTRGGLSKIFGMRQLSRRTSRRGAAPSRQSHLSSTGMLDEEASKSGYIMQGGRLRSESAGSMGVLLNPRQRSSSALDNLSLEASMGPARNFESAAGSFTPSTPGEASAFSFLPSPSGPSRFSGGAPAAIGTSGKFYRPPRARRPTIENITPAADRARGSWASTDWPRRGSGQPAGLMIDASDIDGPVSRSVTPAPYAPHAVNPAPRPDYSTREVDLYYGIRGQPLNSDAQGRKLGTGPADPTGPMSSAAGWFRNLLGGKSKEKGKGFEVVRSTRTPMGARGQAGEFDDDGPPEGVVPLAMGVLRKGPIESDDEDDAKPKKTRPRGPQAEAELLSPDGTPQEDDADDQDSLPRIPDTAPVLPAVDAGESIKLPSRIQSKSSRYAPDDESSGSLVPDIPNVPRRSSKRNSDGTGKYMNKMSHLAPSSTPSRLPFERSDSQKRLSSGSSMGATENLSQVDIQEPRAVPDERPTSYGFVQQGSISRVDRDDDHQGSAAEVVNVEGR